MPHPKYTCPFCKTELIDRYILSHLVSEHKEEFYERYKHTIRGSGLKGNLIYLPLKCDGVDSVNQCCLGCNKLYKKKGLAEQHLADCKKKKEHKAICESLLPTNATVECADSSEAMEALRKQIEALQNENKKLKKKVEDLEEEVAYDAQKVEAFDTVMACIHEKISEEERDEWRDWLKSEKEEVEWEDYL